jgi:hypothetical protein
MRLNMVALFFGGNAVRNPEKGLRILTCVVAQTDSLLLRTFNRLTFVMVPSTYLIICRLKICRKKKGNAYVTPSHWELG